MPRSKADVDVKGFVNVNTSGVKKATTDLRAYNAELLRMRALQGRDTLARHGQNPAQLQRMFAAAAAGELHGVPQDLEKRYRGAMAGVGPVARTIKQRGADPMARKMVQLYSAQARQMDQWLRYGQQQIDATDKSMRRQEELQRKRQAAQERMAARELRDRQVAANQARSRETRMVGMYENLNRAEITQRDRGARVSPRFGNTVYDDSGQTFNQHQRRVGDLISTTRGHLAAGDIDAATRSLHELNTAQKDQVRTANQAAEATSRVGRGLRMVTGVLARMSIAYGGFMVFQLVIESLRTILDLTVGWARELENVQAKMRGVSGSPIRAREGIETAIRASSGTPFELTEVAKSSGILAGRGITPTDSLLYSIQATAVALDQPLEQVTNNVGKLSIRSANLKRGLVQLGISWAAWNAEMDKGLSNLEALEVLLSRNNTVLSAFAATWDTQFKNWKQNFGLASGGLGGGIVQTATDWLREWNLQMEISRENERRGMTDDQYNRQIWSRDIYMGNAGPMIDWARKNMNAEPEFFQNLLTKGGQFALGRMNEQGEVWDPLSRMWTLTESNRQTKRAHDVLLQLMQQGNYEGPDIGREKNILEMLASVDDNEAILAGMRRKFAVQQADGVPKFLLQQQHAREALEGLGPRPLPQALQAGQTYREWNAAHRQTSSEWEIKYTEIMQRLTMATDGLVTARQAAREHEYRHIRALREEFRDIGLTPAVDHVQGALSSSFARRQADKFHGLRIREMNFEGLIGLGANPDQRDLLQHQLAIAQERQRVAGPNRIDQLEAQYEVMQAQGAFDQYQDPMSPGQRLGQIGIRGVRQAFSNVDWGGRRNQQIERQVEALRRQRMEIEGQVEPLTQQELIQTRINDLLAQRSTILGQIGSQLKQQVGNLLVRGLFGAVGAGVGALTGGPAGAALGFNIGFGENIFKAAGGFHGRVDEPTIFLTGEAGPEYVDVTPEGESDGGQAMFVFNNARITANKEEFMDMLEEVGREIEYGALRVEGINNG